VRATGGYRTPLCAISAMVMVSAALYLTIDPRRPVWQDDEP
jgi:hypothetical protein